jgi:hypothetical protein
MHWLSAWRLFVKKKTRNKNKNRNLRKKIKSSKPRE